MRGETSAIVNGLRRVKNYINIPDEKELKKTIKSKTVKLRGCFCLSPRKGMLVYFYIGG